jgi:hypothetical protein
MNTNSLTPGSNEAMVSFSSVDQKHNAEVVDQLTETLGATEYGFTVATTQQVRDGVATIRFSLVPLLQHPGDENRPNYELANVVVPADQEIGVDDVLKEPRQAIREYIFGDRL